MASVPTRGFLGRHRHDPAMVAGVVIAVWLAIVAGFGLDLVRRAHAGQLSFPAIVHLHVVAYVSWLVLLGVQVWLARTRRVGVHRRLGWLAVALIPLMLVLGPAAAWWSASNPYMPDKWIAWLAVQFTNALGSAVLLAAGLVWCNDAAAHKRLMLLGTIALTEPGFGRLWEAPVSARFGDGYVPMFLATYGGTLVLLAGVGVYDRVTRGRLHPAFVAAVLWILGNELVAAWLFHQPFWLAAMRTLTGHPPA